MTDSISLQYANASTHIEIHREQVGTYTVGDAVRMKVVIDDDLVREYANSYGDRNPIHLEENAGRNSIFKARIAHGMLSFNFFSTLLGAGFPGPGTIFTGVDSWRFTAPVKINDHLTLEARVSSVRQKTNGSFELTLEAQALKENGDSVMTGKLLVIAPKTLN